jgi:hypothetical protein
MSNFRSEGSAMKKCVRLAALLACFAAVVEAATKNTVSQNQDPTALALVNQALALLNGGTALSDVTLQASVRYVGSTYNVQLLNNPLDTSSASADGYSDPAVFNAENHPGSTGSYYVSGDYIGIDAGHVVNFGAAGLEAHYDSFAPYNPLHWVLEWLPSQFVNTRGQAGGGVRIHVQSLPGATREAGLQPCRPRIAVAVGQCYWLAAGNCCRDYVATD